VNPSSPLIFKGFLAYWQKIGKEFVKLSIPLKFKIIIFLRNNSHKGIWFASILVGGFIIKKFYENQIEIRIISINEKGYLLDSGKFFIKTV